MKKEIEYEKFICISNEVIRKHIEKIFKKSLMERYYVEDFVRKSDGEGWIIYLKKNNMW